MKVTRPQARPGHRAPGWYSDPAFVGKITPEPRFRWWDGQAWTRWQSASAHAPVPHGPAQQLAADDRIHWTGRHATAAIIAVLMAAVLAMTAVGMRAVAQQPGPGTIKAPARYGVPAVALSSTTDSATVYGKLQVDLPQGSDWETSEAKNLAGYFVRYQLGGIAVGKDQLALWTIAALSPAAAQPDPQRTAEAVVERWRSVATDNYQLLQTSEPEFAPYPALPGAVAATFDDRRAGGLTATHQVLLIPVDAGTENNPHPYAVVITVEPDTTPAAQSAELSRLRDSARLGF